MSLAGPTAGRTTEDHEDIRSNDWPEVNVTHDYDQVHFNGDGLNTGVKVLGMYNDKLSSECLIIC